MPLWNSIAPFQVDARCFEEMEAISISIFPDLCSSPRGSRQVGKDLVTGEVTRVEKVCFVKYCELDSHSKFLPWAMCTFQCLNHVSSLSQIGGERLHNSLN